MSVMFDHLPILRRLCTPSPSLDEVSMQQELYRARGAPPLAFAICDHLALSPCGAGANNLGLQFRGHERRTAVAE